MGNDDCRACWWYQPESYQNGVVMSGTSYLKTLLAIGMAYQGRAL
ncbi:hypothetical protein JCM19239_7384 [Vibrio variabilis]|uniref:Uncharacterized protein n=1 Tax=Vibrio variabilis TaxID=990271 RepID=A0ABQ0J7N1_9VIBR|nr:hypothetical protein JCM19239_7384 [Vibrio variabilis]